jgi:hypothetical protein
MKRFILAAVLCATFGGFAFAASDEAPEKEAKKVEKADDGSEVIKQGDYTVTIKVTGGTYEKTITENEDGSITVKVTGKPNNEGGTVSVKVTAEGNGSSSSSSSSSAGTTRVTVSVG